MRKLILAAALLTSLGACTAAQVKQAQLDQATAQAKITAVCADVTGAATLAAPFSAIPQVAALLTYANASCGTATAVSALVTKAMNDPTTVAWAEALAAQIKAAGAAAKGL